MPSNICDAEGWKEITMWSSTDSLSLQIEYNTTEKVSNIVNEIKQVSADYICEKHPILFKDNNKFWDDGYFACSIGEVTKKMLEEYRSTKYERNPNLSEKG